MTDLIYASNEGIAGNVKIKGSLGCNKMVGLRFLRARKGVKTKLSIPGFKRTKFDISKDLLRRVV